MYDIFLYLQAMLDHIKHSIVSLQIAKNMAHPINGIYNGPGPLDNNSSDTPATATPTSIMLPGILLKSELLGDDEEDSTTDNGKILLLLLL